MVLDADVDVSDAELDALNGGLGNYAGSSLTLVRNGGANAEDGFGFNDGSGVTLVGGNLMKNGQVIAGFDTTTTPGPALDRLHRRRRRDPDLGRRGRDPAPDHLRELERHAAGERDPRLDLR